MRNIRACRVRCNLPTARTDNQVHILHRNSAKENLIAKHECTYKAKPFSELNADWPYIWDIFTPTVSYGDFALRFCFKL